MLKIIVCIKQVPSTNKVEIDQKTGVLRRDNVTSKLNTYDLYALEAALRIKDDYGAEITALTMGPIQAKAVLEEAIYMGADNGVLLTDRRFAGSDVYATSYALSQCIKSINGADIIFCGKQTTDGDTGQVGAEISQINNYNYVSNIISIEKVLNSSITAISNLDYVQYNVEIKFPCLLSVEKDIYTPRLPSLKRKFLIDNIESIIRILTVNDLTDKDENKYGLKGSPTQVERIFPPNIQKQKEIICDSGEVLSKKLYQVLKDKKFI